MEQPTLINVGDRWYIGFFDKTNKRITKAIREKHGIAGWFKSRNLSELVEVEIGDEGYSVQPLDAQRKAEFVKCNALMAESKKLAIPMLENKTFDELNE